MSALPHWPQGTVGVLVTEAGGTLGAIPVSTGVRLDDTRLAFALSGRRASLQKLRDQPRVGWVVMCEDVAMTVFGTPQVVDPLPGFEHMVGVIVEVDEMQDHDKDDFAMTAGVGWHWTDDAAAEKDGQVREAVASLGATT